ncbi:hypothetical protein ACQP2X_07800 [Actinoplanes sp. CA-131856]
MPEAEATGVFVQQVTQPGGKRPPMTGNAPETLAVLRRRLSPERLEPYLLAAGGDLAAALDLYAWNSEISAALGVTSGHVEVLLRNAMHDELVVWSTQRFGEPRWYLDPGHLLQSRALTDIRSARQRVARHGRPETPGRVVAELNLGFWRFLLASHYDRTLWRECLHRVFPGRARRQVHDAVERLHLARNRLAHHEPMFNRPVAEIHATAVGVAAWICRTSGAWIESHSRTVSLLGGRADGGADFRGE